MILESLLVRNFRNLEEAEVPLSPETTVLLGDNGQGKTSVLEAIGVLATTRSFRRARAAELVAHGADGCSVRGRVRSEPAGVDLSVSWEGGRRATRVGRVDTELGEYVGHLTVVAITQAHAGIVRGAPQERRDFLDRGILGIQPSYLRCLSAHRQALRQKNALLRQGGAGTQLGAWNARLAAAAAELVQRRRSYVEALKVQLEELGPRYLPESEPLELQLQDVAARDPELQTRLGRGPAEDRELIASSLLTRMEDLAERELAAGQALVGPHRDDLILESGGRDLRRYASSGQQRNALLALKMAKVEVFRDRRGESPVLLVDDIDTEIDPGRLSTFLRHVGARSQAVLTSSKRDLFSERPANSRFYLVRDGVLSPA